MTMINAYSSAKAPPLPPRGRDLIARRERTLGPAYRLFYEQPVEFVRAQGVWLYDADGAAYLDAYNNVASVGHCHPRVVAALSGQAAMLNTHTRYLNEGVIAYAERLAGKLPAAISQIMFTCTGSEANDLALRIARAHTGGAGIVITENAYHGVTQAVAELSPSLGPYVQIGAHVRTVPAPRAGAAAFAENVARAFDALKRAGYPPLALLVDTVFSSDGLFPDPPGFLADAAEAAHRAGALFIADEVQPGFARTGDHFWGFSRHGVTPDLVTMGKPMGAGHPMAAVAARSEVLEAFGRTCRYFNTFGGNPVSCAVGMAVLDVIEDEGLQANAARVGALLRARLEALGVFSHVRGAGLFIAAEVAEGGAHAARLVNGMRERRVLISATGKDGDILKIRPPLVFSEADVETFVEAMKETTAAL